MKYKEDTNTNIISIGEKLEHYLRGYKDQYVDEGDADTTIVLKYHSTYTYYIHFIYDGTVLSIPSSKFNKREQDYIENTTDKIQYTIGRKVKEC